MDFEQHIYGMTEEGEAAILYIMRAESGAEVHITNHGASVVALKMPNESGEIIDLLPERKEFSDMLRDRTTTNRTMGRVAGCGAPSTLHNKIWEGRFETNRIVMSYLSADGDGGYDGNLEMEAVFDFDEEHLFEVTYLAQCDMPTPINIALDLAIEPQSETISSKEIEAGELYKHYAAYKF